MKINKTNLRVKGSLSWGNKPNKIIIHHPEWYGDVAALNEMMINMGYNMIGYNYYIRKDGSIWEGRPVEAIGGNCKNQNAQSIGVCFEGNYEKDKEMPQIQFKAGVELIKHLMSKHKITEVDGHKAYYNTACPGKYFPLERMLKAIKEKEVKKVKNIVVYGEGPDKRAAEYLADYLKAPIIEKNNLSKDTIEAVENIYMVGGKDKPTENTVLITGSNRFDTIQAVLNFIKK